MPQRAELSMPRRRGFQLQSIGTDEPRNRSRSDRPPYHARAIPAQIATGVPGDRHRGHGRHCGELVVSHPCHSITVSGLAVTRPACRRGHSMYTWLILSQLRLPTPPSLMPPRSRSVRLSRCPTRPLSPSAGKASTRHEKFLRGRTHPAAALRSCLRWQTRGRN